jgi:hypothetical protein
MPGGMGTATTVKVELFAGDLPNGCSKTQDSSRRADKLLRHPPPSTVQAATADDASAYPPYGFRKMHQTTITQQNATRA